MASSSQVTLWPRFGARSSIPPPPPPKDRRPPTPPPKPSRPARAPSPPQAFPPPLPNKLLEKASDIRLNREKMPQAKRRRTRSPGRALTPSTPEPAYGTSRVFPGIPYRLSLQGNGGPSGHSAQSSPTSTFSKIFNTPESWAKASSSASTYSRTNIGNDFSEAYAQMSVLNLEIKKNVALTQAEIKSRPFAAILVSAAPGAGTNATNTPPSSPRSLNSSQGSPTKREKMLETYLRQEAFDDLKRRDEKFKSAMSDITGIRDWWIENCQLHSFKKLQLRVKEENIKYLKQQQKRHQNERDYNQEGHWTSRGQGQVWRDEADKYEEQIRIQESDWLVERAWFIENRMLMKPVYEQFKRAEQRANNAAIIAPEEDVSIRVQLLETYPLTRDYTTEPLFRQTNMTGQTPGIIGWLERVQDDFILYHEYLGRLLALQQERLELNRQLEMEHRNQAIQNVREFEAEEEEFDHRIQDRRTWALRFPAQANEMEEKIQNEVFHRNRNRFKRDERQRLSNLIAVSYMAQDEINEFRRRHLQDRYWRSKKILELVNFYLVEQTRLQQLSQTLSANLLTDLVNIVHWEFVRQEATWKVDDLIELEIDGGKPYASKRLMDHIKAHLNKDRMSSGVKKCLAAAKDREFLPTSLGEILKLWRTEATGYVKAADEAQNLAARYLESRLDLTDEMMKEDAKLIENDIELVQFLPPQLPQNLDTPFGRFLKLDWNDGGVRNAVRILSTPAKSGKGTTFHVFEDFFNSPDIFPLFKLKGKTWTKKEFFEFIQSLVREQLRPEGLEAYLTWCNYTEDKFQTTMILGRVVVSIKGWQRRYESPVSTSLTRKIHYERPPGARKLGKLMVRNQDIFAFDKEVRNLRKWKLLEKLNKITPDEKLIDMKGLQIYLNYWTSVGLFFVESDPSVNRVIADDHSMDTGDRTSGTRDVEWKDEWIHRVDNGWDFSNSPYWPPIDTKCESFNEIDAHVHRKKADILSSLRYVDGSPNPVTTEKGLYDLLYLQAGQKLNIQCTEYSFHFYLRWCSQTGYFFNLKRNGEVGVIDRVWDDVIYNGGVVRLG